MREDYPLVPKPVTVEAAILHDGEKLFLRVSASDNAAGNPCGEKIRVICRLPGVRAFSKFVRVRLPW